MTVSRPPELGAGARLRLDGALVTVVKVTGTEVELQDVTGARLTLTGGELFASPGFELVTARPAPLPPPGLLDGLPAHVVSQAQW